MIKFICHCVLLCPHENIRCLFSVLADRKDYYGAVQAGIYRIYGG